MYWFLQQAYQRKQPLQLSGNGEPAVPHKKQPRESNILAVAAFQASSSDIFNWYNMVKAELCTISSYIVKESAFVEAEIILFFSAAFIAENNSNVPQINIGRALFYAWW
jgi:hypothetical protein